MLAQCEMPSSPSFCVQDLIKVSEVSASVDLPEAGMDALMQVYLFNIGLIFV